MEYHVWIVTIDFDVNLDLADVIFAARLRFVLC